MDSPFAKHGTAVPGAAKRPSPSASSYRGRPIHARAAHEAASLAPRTKLFKGVSLVRPKKCSARDRDQSHRRRRRRRQCHQPHGGARPARYRIHLRQHRCAGAAPTPAPPPASSSAKAALAPAATPSSAARTPSVNAAIIAEPSRARTWSSSPPAWAAAPAPAPHRLWPKWRARWAS